MASSLEDAIAVVRSVIDIPDEMTEFDTYSYVSEVNGEQLTVWDLYWSNESYDKSMSACVDSKGNLIYFNQYNWGESQTGLARVSRTQAEKTAQAFLQKVLPDDYSDMQQVNEAENKNSYYGGHDFVYQLFHNDIPVSNVIVNIQIDKYTGELKYYSGLNEGMVLPSSYPEGNTISKEQAKQVYLDEFGMELQYSSYYDYDTKAFSVFPVYEATDTYSKAIDAQTGTVVNVNDDTNYDWIRSYSGSAVMGSDSSYSYVEQQTIEGLEGIISKEEAEQILRQAMEDLPDDVETYGANLHQNDISCSYTWELYFDNGYGMVDATTGKIQSFYTYLDYESNTAGDLTLAAAKAKAESFMQAQQPEIFTQVVDINTEEQSNGVNARYLSLSYARYVNGIPFYNNGFYVVLDTVTGNIVEYSVSWNDNLTFPAIDNVVTEMQAFEAIDAQYKLDLAYVPAKDGMKLVYAFSNSPYLAVSAVTGEVIYYDGSVYTGNTYMQNYVDIDMHWSRDIVIELQENGYFLDGSEFRPDDAITRRDFLRYLNGYWWNYDDNEYVDSYFKNMGYVLEGEDMEAELTRQDAAKIIIRYLGLSLAADQSDAFKNDFNDSVPDGYLGYAMLCKSLGIMQGDASGNFNGSQVLTRAEAANIIYNLLTRV